MRARVSKVYCDTGTPSDAMTAARAGSPPTGGRVAASSRLLVASLSCCCAEAMAVRVSSESDDGTRTRSISGPLANLQKKKKKKKISGPENREKTKKKESKVLRVFAAKKSADQRAG
jgi:hypothetical protein